MYKAPPLLKPGDTISIAAPGRKVNPADITKAITLFQDWGLQVSLSKHLHSNSHSYLAGSDNERLADFQHALNDPNIKGIICARGGYGSTRILDHIDIAPLQKNPKWIVGFSDITAIHLMLHCNGYQSIHGTMPILFAKESSVTSVESLRLALFEGRCAIQSPPHQHSRQGAASGLTIGGNLSLIVDSLGTCSEPDTANTILMIEEIDEYLYRADRMMTQLKRAGKLKDLKGLIVGHMTDMKDTELKFGQTIEEIILNSVKEYNFPVLFGFPSGHENPNLAWFHGGHARLNVDSSGGQLAYEQIRS